MTRAGKDVGQRILDKTHVQSARESFLCIVVELVPLIPTLTPLVTRFSESGTEQSVRPDKRQVFYKRGHSVVHGGRRSLFCLVNQYRAIIEADVAF